MEDGDVAVGGRRGTRGRRRQGQRQRRMVAATRRKTPSSMVGRFEGAVEVAELNDSDAENVLCEQLARSLSRIQVGTTAAGIGGGDGSTVEEGGGVEVERRHGKGNRGQRRGVKNRTEDVDANMRVTRSMCVDSGDGGGVAGSREEHQKVVSARRLVPLSEAGQFVDLESEAVEEVTPRPPRRVLRPRKVV